MDVELVGSFIDAVARPRRRIRLRSITRSPSGPPEIIDDLLLAHSHRRGNNRCAHVVYSEIKTVRLAPPCWKLAALFLDVRILPEQSCRAAYHLNDRRTRGDRQWIGD